MDDKKWIERIDRKMEGFEMPPPKGLWEDINRQVHPNLVERKTIKLYNRKIWAVAAMLTAALVIGGGVWLDIHQEENPMPCPTVAKISSVSDKYSCQDTKVLSEKKVDTYFAQADRATIQHQAIPRCVEASSLPVEEVDSDVILTPHESPKDLYPQQTQHRKSVRRDSSYGSQSWDDTFLGSHRSQNAKISVSLTASNFMSSNNQHEGYGELLAGSIWQDNSNEGGSEGDLSDDFGALEEVIVGNSDKKVYTKKKHHQPVKVGVSVNWQLNERWSIGTGVTYSYLSSDLVSGTDDSHYTTHQKLQYVGIPLNLSYAFYQRKRWSVYGSVGSLVEKCVKGKSTTDFVVSGKDETPKNDDVKEKKLQYSVNAAVGLQLRVANHVGFYIEPGVGYHFDNHSDVTNIYKDTPLNFSLGLGLRYSF